MQNTKEKQNGFDVFLRVMIAVSAVCWIVSLSPYSLGSLYDGGTLWFLIIKTTEVVFAVILFVYAIFKSRKVSDMVVRRLFIYGLVLIALALSRVLETCDPSFLVGSGYLYFWSVWEWIFAFHELICSLLVLLCWFLMIKKPKKTNYIGMVICIITVLTLSVGAGVVTVINMGVEGLWMFWLYGNWWKYVCYLSYCLWRNRMRYFKTNGRNVPGGAGIYAGQHVITQERNKTIDNSCPECGKPYDKKDAFCGGCGYRFIKLACPECGKEGDAGDRFCKKCGIRLVEAQRQIQEM